MNKKPVARSGFQHTLLGNGAVYGLLSPYNAAIVVNCFTLNTKSRGSLCLTTCLLFRLRQRANRVYYVLCRRLR
ncbi:acid stress response protein YqgB [Enterobacter roggenkampii]|nr:acid stress response protein YqgB [Enterobacter roggenkampii]WCF41203.1 acid stress response protein YqgB [Enterobacter roggenkampii]